MTRAGKPYAKSAAQEEDRPLPRPAGNGKLHRLLLVVTGRPAIAGDETSSESTRQLAGIALSWLGVALLAIAAVVLALHLQAKRAGKPAPRAALHQAWQNTAYPG